MKKNKFGFTMAELLLSLAIIGIVTSLGVTATKHTAQKAYNKYYYTGYSSLRDVLNDIVYSTDDGAAVVIDKKALDGYFSDGVKEDTEDENYDDKLVKTKNGIQYKILYDANNEYIFEMRVPQPKTRVNSDGYAKTLLYFNSQSAKDKLDNNNIGDLVPFDGGSGYVNLRDRRDLVAFFLDDGKAGRVTADASGNKSYKKFEYKKYTDACVDDVSTTLIDGETTYTVTSECSGSSDGILRSAPGR